MRYIILDLEMNRIAERYREERQVCKMEVIEIGAVVLNEKSNPPALLGRME